MGESQKPSSPLGAGRLLSTAEAGQVPKVRIYVEPTKLETDRAILTGSAFHHIKNVLRMNPGDTLVVFDGAGREVLAVLEVFQAGSAIARVLADAAASTESALDLTLAPSLAKGKKIDLVIEKAVELGVSRVCVTTSRRSIAQLSTTAALDRVERWRRLAVSASEQSGRTMVPVVERIRPLEEFAATKPPDALGLVFTRGALPDPPATLRQRYPDTAKVICVVGPEGGFTEDEIEICRLNGFIDVGLGPRILRTETAAIVAAAICQHLWGDLGRQPPKSGLTGGRFTL
jgi:16S rRNA (uracil1498-N3)-methyltransferase